MDDIDLLLSLVENPTRRRILERIVMEPSYPLQLSKELGLSTQAILKNLALMEQCGVVEKREVRSDMGPNRALYSPSMEFTLVVDMRSHMFSARIVEPENAVIHEMENMSARLEEIDARIIELEKERSRLMSERSRITQMLQSRMDGDNGGSNTPTGDTVRMNMMIR